MGRDAAWEERQRAMLDARVRAGGFLKDDARRNVE
jgi:hypothetical protein